MVALPQLRLSFNSSNQSSVTITVTPPTNTITAVIPVIQTIITSETETASNTTTTKKDDATIESAASLNLRKGPGTEYPTISNYPRGTPLKVMGKNENELWLNVETPDENVGWMMSSYLNINIDLAQIETINTPNTSQSTSLAPTSRIETPRGESQFDGRWQGETSEGHFIIFFVENGYVSHVVIERSCGAEVLTGSGGPSSPSPVYNAYFTAENDFIGYKITGVFETETGASGNFSVTEWPECPGTSTGTWSATKQ